MRGITLHIEVAPIVPSSLLPLYPYRLPTVLAVLTLVLWPAMIWLLPIRFPFHRRRRGVLERTSRIYLQPVMRPLRG